MRISERLAEYRYEQVVFCHDESTGLRAVIVVHNTTLPKLSCSIVAGSANNVLAETRHGEALYERGILYAPDYVINAGGLITVADELEGYNKRRATKRVMRIRDSVRRIFAISKRDEVPTNVAADTLALERIDAIGSMVRLHTGPDAAWQQRADVPYFPCFRKQRTTQPLE